MDGFENWALISVSATQAHEEGGRKAAWGGRKAAPLRMMARCV
jgi:hypothetical protein